MFMQTLICTLILFLLYKVVSKFFVVKFTIKRVKTSFPGNLFRNKYLQSLHSYVYTYVLIKLYAMKNSRTKQE